MSEKEKTAAMNDFASGKTKILISTTVVEVGVDVPQAVNIAVYNPDRYGLSQLHQLRGRVGRGEKHGYCFLVASDISESAFDRLHYLEKCSDGFALAEYDFDSRGAGDFLGLSQHGKGDMPGFGGRSESRKRNFARSAEKRRNKERNRSYHKGQQIRVL